MRVTNSMVMNSALGDLNRSLVRLQDSQTELSSGRTLRVVSDDPTSASSAMTIRNELRRADQRSRSLTDAQAWLGTADATLVSGLDVLAKLKELTVRAGNSGASGGSVQQTLAAEIGQLRDELIGLSNTTYLGRSIFGGTAGGAAYDGNGAYLGNDAAVLRDVAPNTSIEVNLTGPTVFGDQTAPEGDIFAVLDRLASAVASGDPVALAVEHDHLDAAATRWSSGAASIGSRAARLDKVEARNAVAEGGLRETLADLEDADLAEALINVKARENAYTAALQAASRVIPPSLLDYMR